MSEDMIDDWYRQQLEAATRYYAEDPNTRREPTRYSDRNRNEGWDYSDVRAEFEDFFDNNDIAEFTADDWNKLEQEFDAVFSMLEKAETSGKLQKEIFMKGSGEDDMGWWESQYYTKSGKGMKGGKKGSRRKYEQMYETALYSAGESQGRQRGKRGGKRGDDDDLRGGALIAITAAASVLITVLIFSLVIYCMKKRQRDPLTSAGNESELVQANGSTPVPNRDSTISMPSAMPPVSINNGPAAQNVRKVNDDLVYEV